MRQQDGTVRRRRGWRRREATDPGTTDPAVLFHELQRREMRDLETCRRVWEQEGDPLALCEAVRQSDLPAWLSHSLLAMLTDGVSTYPSLRRKLWRERTKDNTDSVRAASVSGVRTLSCSDQFTWESAYVLGDGVTRNTYGDIGSISPAGLKRCYQRVAARLKRPYRYYRARPGMAQQITLAWNYMLALMEASLSAKKQGTPAPTRSIQTPTEACATLGGMARDTTTQRAPRLVGVKPASREYGITYGSLRNILQRSELPHIRIGRAMFLDRRDLEDWIESHKERA